jgi:hypothetical protein
MSDAEPTNNADNLDSISIGDMVESLSTGRLGLVRNIVFADGEPYVYGPYIVVIWVVKGYESCWIPHYDFKIISKGSKK